MSAINDEKQREALKNCDDLRKLHDETSWIERNFYELTFFKRLMALGALEHLRSEISTITQKIARLENDDGRKL